MNAAYIRSVGGHHADGDRPAAASAPPAWRSHRTQSRLDFIRSLGTEAELYAAATPIVERVQTPLVQRIFGPWRGGLRHNLSRLYPSSDIDRVHADLLKAGLTGTIRAEEFVAVQVGAGHARLRHSAWSLWSAASSASRWAWRSCSSCP